MEWRLQNRLTHRQTHRHTLSNMWPAPTKPGQSVIWKFQVLYTNKKKRKQPSHGIIFITVPLFKVELLCVEEAHSISAILRKWPLKIRDDITQKLLSNGVKGFFRASFSYTKLINKDVSEHKQTKSFKYTDQTKVSSWWKCPLCMGSERIKW